MYVVRLVLSTEVKNTYQFYNLYGSKSFSKWFFRTYFGTLFIRVTYRYFMKKQWQSHLDKKSLIQAVVFGSVTGGVSWLYALFVQELEKTSTGEWYFIHMAIVLCIILASASIFLYIFRQRAPHYRHFVFIPFGVLAVEALLPIVLNRGEDFTIMIVMLMCITALLSIGFLLAIQDRVKKSEIPQLFSLFIKKVLEVLFLGFVVGCIFSMMGFVSGLLLEAVNFELPFEIPEELFILLTCIASYTTSFLVWIIIYDFSVPLKEQKEMYVILPLFRVISGCIAVFSVIFLALYIIFLIPSGFDSLLETGITVPLFLCITFGVVAAHFFITEKIRHHDFAKWLKYTTIIFLALSLEAVVLLFVAFNAIYQRIAENDITFARIWVIILLLIASVVLVRFITIWIGGLLKKYSPEDIVEKLQQTYLWPFIGLAIAVVGCVCINIETLSLSRHLDRLSQTTWIRESIDHSFVESVNPKKAIPILVKKYESAGTVNRLDIIYTLDLLTKAEKYGHYDVGYSTRKSPHTEQVSEALEKIAEIETNPDIDAIIKNLQESPFPSDFYFCDSFASSRDCYHRCEKPVADLLDISSATKALEEFCE